MQPTSPANYKQNVDPKKEPFPKFDSKTFPAYKQPPDFDITSNFCCAGHWIPTKSYFGSSTPSTWYLDASIPTSVNTIITSMQTHKPRRATYRDVVFMPLTLEKADFFVKMFTFDMAVTHLAPSRTVEGLLVEVHSGRGDPTERFPMLRTKYEPFVFIMTCAVHGVKWVCKVCEKRDE